MAKSSRQLTSIDSMLAYFDDMQKCGFAADPSPARIILPLRRLRDVIQRGDQEVARKHGLSWVEFQVLATLRHTPPHSMRPSEFYDRLLITSGGLTKILKRLVADGLIESKANEEDRRSHFVRLTAKGKRLVEKVIANFERVNEKKFSSILSRNEQAKLHRLLIKCLESMSDDT